VTTWTIGEAAAKCGLSQHTLRWYERIGLLANIERGGDGRRRFSQGDLDWLSLLTKLRASWPRSSALTARAATPTGSSAASTTT
jgi:hypothetical protein